MWICEKNIYVWMKIFCFVFADMKTDTFENVFVDGSLSRRHNWRFYTSIAAYLIARENLKQFSPLIDSDTPGDFFRRSRRFEGPECFENSCDILA